MLESAEDLSSSSTNSSTSSRGHYGGLGGHGGQPRYYRKPSRNRTSTAAATPGLVQLRKSHVVGSMASLIMANNNNNNSLNNNNVSKQPPPRRPSSLHIPVTSTRSASAAISPILSAATRAIHQFAAKPVMPEVNQNPNPTSSPRVGVVPMSAFHTPLIVPSAEFSPNRHLTRQGRSSSSSSITLHSGLHSGGTGGNLMPGITKGQRSEKVLRNHSPSIFTAHAFCSTTVVVITNDSARGVHNC